MGGGCSCCCCPTAAAVVEDNVLSELKDAPVSTNPISNIGEGEEEEEEDVCTEDTTLDNIQEPSYGTTSSSSSS